MAAVHPDRIHGMERLPAGCGPSSSSSAGCGRAPCAVIPDVGCGSGRDLRRLRHRGYRAVGLERSPGLARLARENACWPVLEADFTAFDFASLSVDGMLLVGAFVHVPHRELSLRFS